MKILYLTHRVPYAPNRGDRLRAFHALRLLAAEHQVSLVSLAHGREETRDLSALRPLVRDLEIVRVSRAGQAVRAARGLATGRPLTHCLLDASGMRPALERIVRRRQPEVVLAYCSGMARFAVEPPLADIPFVLDLVDVDSLKWAELALATRGPLGRVYAREAQRLRAFEARASLAARAALVVNERERAALVRLAPDAYVRIVPNGVDLESFAPPAGVPRRRDVVFCGVMNYGPNADAARWLARDVWPRVRRDVADARLLIVGADPTAAVRALASPRQQIEVTGTVSDVRPYLWQAVAAAAPLATARGVQNKVLEAVAAGTPCVVTPQVAEGLPHEVLPACVQAADAHAFAVALARLLHLADDERRALVAGADLASLGWPQRLAALPAILEAAAFSRESAAALGLA